MKYLVEYNSFDKVSFRDTEIMKNFHKKISDYNYLISKNQNNLKDIITLKKEKYKYVYDTIRKFLLLSGFKRDLVNKFESPDKKYFIIIDGLSQKIPVTIPLLFYKIIKDKIILIKKQDFHLNENLFDNLLKDEIIHKYYLKNIMKSVKQLNENIDLKTHDLFKPHIDKIIKFNKEYSELKKRKDEVDKERFDYVYGVLVQTLKMLKFDQIKKDNTLFLTKNEGIKLTKEKGNFINVEEIKNAGSGWVYSDNGRKLLDVTDEYVFSEFLDIKTLKNRFLEINTEFLKKLNK